MQLSEHTQLTNCCSVSSADTVQSESEREQIQSFVKVALQKSKEKSELCKKFITYGVCPYGHLCKFAHGSHELRQNNRTNHRYKTKMCESFFNQNYCQYGARCNFKHSSEKLQYQKHEKCVQQKVDLFQGYLHQQHNDILYKSR